MILFIVLSALLSGFSLMLTGSTLNFILFKFGISKLIIGIFGIAIIPYSLNFLWSFIFDQVHLFRPIVKIFSKKTIHIEGREEFLSEILYKFFWMIFLSLGLYLSIKNLSSNIHKLSYSTDNLDLIKKTGYLSALVSFFSASKDSLLGSMRITAIDSNKMYKSWGIYVASYRIGMILSNSFLIYLSTFFSWSSIYLYSGIAVLILGFVISINYLYLELDRYKNFLSQKNQLNFSTEEPSRWIITKIKIPKHYFIVLFFLFLYKMPDNLINSVINGFLIEMEFSESEIALSNKTISFIGSFIGSGLAARWMSDKKDIKKDLFNFKLAHLVSYLILIIQSLYSKNTFLLILSTFFGSVTGGMTTAVYLGLINIYCTGKYKATKYSIFTSIMGLSRAVFPIISGILCSYLNWPAFFFICILSGIPSFVLLKRLKI